MAVRKRIWKTKTGETRAAWVVDYADAAGDRHIETFTKKKEVQTTKNVLVSYSQKALGFF